MVVFEFYRGGDLQIILEASKALKRGENIYARSYFDGFHYLYSPLFAILIHPLTYLPIGWAGTIWKVANFYFLARTFYLISHLFQLKGDRMPVIMILTFAAVLLPLYSNVHMIQLSALMLYLSFSGLDLIFRRERKVTGAGLIALAVNIKLLPLVFIAYLVYRAEWKAATWVLVFSMALIMLPATLLGWDRDMQLHLSWWQTINPSKQLNMIDLDERGFHSLTAWLSSLLTDQFGPNELHLRRNVLSLKVDTVSVIINVVRASMILSTMWFLRTRPFRKARYPFAQFHEIAAICAMVPLIFPHQQVYGFLFLLPSTFYLVYFYFNARLGFRHAWKFNMLLVLGCLSFFIVNLEMIFGFARIELWHYKTLTYGALLQLLTLALCDPARVENAGEDELSVGLFTSGHGR